MPNPISRSDTLPKLNRRSSTWNPSELTHAPTTIVDHGSAMGEVAALHVTLTRMRLASNSSASPNVNASVSVDMSRWRASTGKKALEAVLEPARSRERPVDRNSPRRDGLSSPEPASHFGSLTIGDSGLYQRRVRSAERAGPSSSGLRRGHSPGPGRSANLARSHESLRHGFTLASKPTLAAETITTITTTNTDASRHPAHASAQAQAQAQIQAKAPSPILAYFHNASREEINREIALQVEVCESIHAMFSEGRMSVEKAKEGLSWGFESLATLERLRLMRFGVGVGVGGASVTVSGRMRGRMNYNGADPGEIGEAQLETGGGNTNPGDDDGLVHEEETACEAGMENRDETAFVSDSDPDSDSNVNASTGSERHSRISTLDWDNRMFYIFRREETLAGVINRLENARGTSPSGSASAASSSNTVSQVEQETEEQLGEDHTLEELHEEYLSTLTSLMLGLAEKYPIAVASALLDVGDVEQGDTISDRGGDQASY